MEQFFKDLMKKEDLVWNQLKDHIESKYGVDAKNDIYEKYLRLSILTEIVVEEENKQVTIEDVKF